MGTARFDGFSMEDGAMASRRMARVVIAVYLGRVSNIEDAGT